MSKLVYLIKTQMLVNKANQPEHFDAIICFKNRTHFEWSKAPTDLLRDMTEWCETNIGFINQDFKAFQNSGFVLHNAFRFKNESDLTAFLLRWQE